MTNEIIQKENTDAFKKCMVDSSVIADIINHKMNLGVPIERMSQYFQSMNIELSSSLLSRYMMAAANILTPIYEAMVKALVNNSNQVIHCDETPLKVLDNQKERVWSYMFVLATSFWDNPIYIYDFNMTRKTDRIEKYLKDYTGYLIVDAYKGYDKFKEELKPTVEEIQDKAKFKLAGVQSCWTHLRRLFVEVDANMLANTKKEYNNESIAAYKVVKLIAKLFQKEAEFKTKKLTKDNIKRKRNTQAYNKILNDIKSYVELLNPAKGTKLAKACGYLKNHWNELITMQKYGGVDINNSLCERAVRPFATSRGAFLFCKSNNGATATGILFSIVQTARINGLYVEGYLNYIFNNLDTKPVSELLPWSETLPSDLKIKVKK